MVVVTRADMLPGMDARGMATVDTAAASINTSTSTRATAAAGATRSTSTSDARAAGQAEKAVCN